MVRGDNMAVCYKKLWKMLIDKDMIKKRLTFADWFKYINNVETVER